MNRLFKFGLHDRALHCAPDAPTPPDPKVTAAAQTGTNVSTAVANAALSNVNQVTPYGSMNWDVTGNHSFTDPTTGAKYDVPTYTATQTLSPGQQQIFDQSQGAQKNLATLANNQSAFLNDYLGKPMDASKVPAGGDAANLSTPNYQQFGAGPQLKADYGPADGYAGNVKSVEDAMFSRLNPQIDQQRSAMEASLANQGIRIGSTAYDTAMSQFNQGVNDQRTSVLLASGQEQTRLADLDAQRAGFQNAAQQQMFQNQNQATGQNNQLQDQSLNAQLAKFNAQNQQRSQALNETYANRAQPINEITSLLGNSQIQQPNFVNANMPNIPTVDYAGLVNENYNQKLGIYNQQNAASQGILGGLFGLGSSMIMASDRRLKTDIDKIGKTDDGQNIYSYRYKAGGPKQIGLMAQEVEKKHPDAVVKMASGFKGVNYGKALSGLLAHGAAA